MATNHTTVMSPRQPLRLWPGISAVALQTLLWIVAPLAFGWGVLIAAGGSVLLGIVVAVWWLFFSRAAWLERIAAIVLSVVAVWAAFPIVHASVSNGMMGGMLPVYSIAPLCLALVGWAAVSHRLDGALRLPAMAVAIALACAVMALIRTDGIKSGGAQLQWRWTPSAEERLLARGNDDPKVQPVATVTPAVEAPAPATAIAPPPGEVAAPSAPVTAPSVSNPADEATSITAAAATATPVTMPIAWPGFRGPARDGVIRGLTIDTNWSQQPPVTLWRQPIGPGWSSFAVRGDLIYTQEQRGDDEIVSAYSIKTGEPVWRHRDPARFWESNGGAGPRGTPTLSADGVVYTFGGTGVVNALDASSGKVIWSRNAGTDAKKAVPEWGFSSSPVVLDDMVVVGVDGRLVAYERATGKPRWFGPVHGNTYSSPHLMTIDGVTQILYISNAGLTSVASDGTVLWEHDWPGGAIIQPARMGEREVLFSVLGGAMGGAGTRRLSLDHSSGKWNVQERWTSNGLKPFFNDYVIHKGHAYGFDGSILAAIDLNDGKRVWKGGRYGDGQLVLLADQDLLLVTSEEGELALVRAAPDQFTEVARASALEGKTWNHPVIVGDVLLVRNGEEMAAFRLPTAR
jgi:outer membrane protein assembly factor BamB